MRRKYLDNLPNIERWDVRSEQKSVRELHKKECEIYGFDSRECYRMDLSFVSWLYERVSMFRDMTSHRDDLHHVLLEYIGHLISQAALIDILLRRCRHCLTDYKDKRLSEEYYADIDECIRIWSILIPTMWLD